MLRTIGLRALAEGGYKDKVEEDENTQARPTQAKRRPHLTLDSQSSMLKIFFATSKSKKRQRATKMARKDKGSNLTQSLRKLDSDRTYE